VVAQPLTDGVGGQRIGDGLSHRGPRSVRS
jgi:hypothetical protein